jgi:arylsulfatase A-like enzyme
MKAHPGTFNHVMAGYIQAGSVCREPVVCCDFYPTFSELAKCPCADQPMDGVSLTSLFMQPAGILNRSELYWYYPHNKMAAVRSRDWKLVEHMGNGTIELYHLPDDLSEKNDISRSHPDIAGSIYQKLKRWRSSIPRLSDVNTDGKIDLQDLIALLKRGSLYNLWMQRAAGRHLIRVK